jgi:hypothetical protein
MQPEGRPQEIPTFASPEEELKYLRERVAEKEQSLAKEAEPVKQEAAISHTITHTINLNSIGLCKCSTQSRL